MDALLRIGKNVKNINYSQLLNNILSNNSVQKYILDMNREDQLFKDGINILGEKLRSEFARFGQVYSNNTINLKRDKGQPVDRVTLKDEGNFYRTFNIELNPNDFEIQANTIKEGEDLQDRFPDIIGLTGSNKEILRLFIKDELIPLVKNHILSRS